MLGQVGGVPSKARSVVLRNNGIKSRHYAFRNGKSTHSNAELAAKAVQHLFGADIPIETLDLLAAGTTSPDQLLPSHAAMVHGELGLAPIEILSSTGACVSSIQALKYAYLAVGSESSEVAATVGSEKLSSWMHASRYAAEHENLSALEADPILAFEKDFLRWMLSDGAAAALLQPKPAKDGPSLRIEWLEILSFAGEMETCMYAGALKGEDKKLQSWNDVAVSDWANHSLFSLRQDTRMLGEHIVQLGGRMFRRMMEKHRFGTDEVDYFLPHLSSLFFKGKIMAWHAANGVHLPEEKWFVNLPRVGNVGAASPFLMLDELFHSGRLKNGQKILVMIPESARFSYAYLYLTVV